MIQATNALDIYYSHDKAFQLLDNYEMSVACNSGQNSNACFQETAAHLSIRAFLRTIWGPNHSDDTDDNDCQACNIIASMIDNFASKNASFMSWHKDPHALVSHIVWQSQTLGSSIVFHFMKGSQNYQATLLISTWPAVFLEHDRLLSVRHANYKSCQEHHIAHLVESIVAVFLEQYL